VQNIKASVAAPDWNREKAMTKQLSATLEDYLGVVLRFQREKRFARVSDIAAALGVAKSAVTAALQSLASRDLINYQPYEPVTLTEEGEQQAEDILVRHQIILDFLRNVLAIDAREADSIACEMEHAINAAALEKFVCFLAFIGTRSGKGKTWLTEFQRFAKSGAEGRTCKECIKEYLHKARDTMGTFPA
jgi:DtxR family transcriptional regulator, Mn-dependent transcriptional regulator